MSRSARAQFTLKARNAPGLLGVLGSWQPITLQTTRAALAGNLNLVRGEAGARGTGKGGARMAAGSGADRQRVAAARTQDALQAESATLQTLLERAGAIPKAGGAGANGDQVGVEWAAGGR